MTIKDIYATIISKENYRVLKLDLWNNQSNYFTYWRWLSYTIWVQECQKKSGIVTGMCALNFLFFKDK